MEQIEPYNNGFCKICNAYVNSSNSDPDENHLSSSGTLDKISNSVRERIPTSFELPSTWKERIFVQLDRADNYLDKKVPNVRFQDRADKLGRYIEKRFAPLKEFNKWLNDNGHENWFHQLAIFLAKLPIRSARNIIQLLYNAIKEILYCGVHPLKGLTQLARLLTNLVNALTQPESWSKMGVGIIGANLGVALALGQPVSLIAVGIGTAMVLTGLSIGSLTEALEAEGGQRYAAAKKNILSQAKDLPESMLTGFLMGLIMGGIQRAIQRAYRVTNYQEAQSYADKFIKEHNLPQYTKVELTSSGKIIIKWSGKQFEAVKIACPEYIKGLKNTISVKQTAKSMQIELSPSSSQYRLLVETNDYLDEGTCLVEKESSLASVGFPKDHVYYPFPHENMFLEYGPATAAIYFQNR